jgi:hypothetical protein
MSPVLRSCLHIFSHTTNEFCSVQSIACYHNFIYPASYRITKMEDNRGDNINNNGWHGTMCPNVNDPFPLKLHKMLEDVEKEGRAWIISWNEDGRSFTVHKPKVFAQSIMQKHFNQTKYKSFQRQLNLYNFQRVPRGKVKGVCTYKMRQ